MVLFAFQPTCPLDVLLVCSYCDKILGYSRNVRTISIGGSKDMTLHSIVNKAEKRNSIKK